MLLMLTLLDLLVGVVVLIGQIGVGLGLVVLAAICCDRRTA